MHTATQVVKMTDTTALQSFLDKWRSRWPEWQVVEVFVPEPQRAVALAWFALLQEFSEAMNIAGDPLPADAKLAWWGEELRDWQRQRSRHPLGRVLEPLRAPWFDLAEALPVLIQLRDQATDEAAVFATARPLAVAAARVEAVLFDDHSAGEALVQALTAHWLAERLEAASGEAVPRDFAGSEAGATQAWARQLLARWPERGLGAPPRRLVSALARSRLQRAAGAGEGVAPLSPRRALWLGWRAARRR